MAEQYPITPDLSPAPAPSVRHLFHVMVPVTTAGKAVRARAVNAHRIWLQGADGNTGLVYVGGSTVTNASGANRGLGLSPGEILPDPVPLGNTGQIYVDADNNNDQLIILGVG
jgi:hypothetical protein